MTPPDLQSLEEWPEAVSDRDGHELEPGYLVRVLGHDGGRSHDGHVVDCRKVDPDGEAWLAIWEHDTQSLAPHCTRFIQRQHDEEGRPIRWSGQENDDMAKKNTKKAPKKNTKAAKPRRSKATQEEAAANEAPSAEEEEPIRKHARQGSLPGTTDPAVDELDKLCAEFKDHDDSMHSHKAECNKLRGGIALAMQKHERGRYEYANKIFEYSPGAPKLKVKTIKEDEE